VFYKLIRSSDVYHFSKADLGDDGTKFAAGGRDTMSSRTVSCREHLSGNDECRHVRPEVLEEVGETVEEDERLCARRRRHESVVCETCTNPISWNRNGR
jgi:hypothetical protein